jgi:protein-S-isoprenylcysteine O-methyltransferase Ste14
VLEDELENRMSRWGTGPLFAVLSLIYGTLAGLVGRHFYPLFHIGFLSPWFLTLFGSVLIVIGIPFCIISAKKVMRAYDAGELVTDGVYRHCRHPLYASWVVFIGPGIALLLDSWLVLTTAVFMYLLLRILVKKEEAYLESTFGSKYREYKKQVPCIMPYGVIKPGV